MASHRHNMLTGLLHALCRRYQQVHVLEFWRCRRTVCCNDCRWQGETGKGNQEDWQASSYAMWWIADGCQYAENIIYPYIGTVSTFKGRDGFEIVTLLGMKFYMNPPPSLSPTSSIIIPAWMVGTCSKNANATLTESTLKIPLVPGLANHFWNCGLLSFEQFGQCGN